MHVHFTPRRAVAGRAAHVVFAALLALAMVGSYTVGRSTLGTIPIAHADIGPCPDNTGNRAFAAHSSGVNGITPGTLFLCGWDSKTTNGRYSVWGPMYPNDCTSPFNVDVSLWVVGNNGTGEGPQTEPMCHTFWTDIITGPSGSFAGRAVAQFAFNGNGSVVWEAPPAPNWA